MLAVSYDPPDTLTDNVFGLDDAALRRIVALTLARVDVSRSIEVSLLITDDEGLRALNRDYRNRDEVTDVLSFPLLDEPLVRAPSNELWQPQEDDEEPDDVFEPEAEDELPLDDLFADADDVALDGDDGELDDLDLGMLGSDLLPIGDIAISREAVARQAKEAGHTPAWELAYLLAHGVLHLVGYDDHSQAGYRAMVTHQEAVLGAADIPQ